MLYRIFNQPIVFIPFHCTASLYPMTIKKHPIALADIMLAETTNFEKST
jgi:hypothetical protein